MLTALSIIGIFVGISIVIKLIALSALSIFPIVISLAVFVLAETAVGHFSTKAEETIFTGGTGIAIYIVILWVFVTMV